MVSVVRFFCLLIENGALRTKKTLKIFRSLHIIFINLIAYNIKLMRKIIGEKH